ncbi:unnamed protein product [Polarella glacialis]|uniref:Uncharacterized protein n=1 Tax=Polarella glacialis TaxID=89957 RepID=A0A813JLQ8_POLGL|nr:unnamed protein product [Polarella glacialis]
MDSSDSNPGGKSEWEFLDVGGDCRYWPVSAWLQFQVGCRELAADPALSLEYQTHLDLQGLGITALQVLAEMLPAAHAVPKELRGFKEAWNLYWEDATRFWAALLDTFRHGGDWVVLKQEFVALGVHAIVADRLRAVRAALELAMHAALGHNGNCWPLGSASLMSALLAMVSSGEQRHKATTWEDVLARLGHQPHSVGKPASSKATQQQHEPTLAKTVKEERDDHAVFFESLQALAAKVMALSDDFNELQRRDAEMSAVSARSGMRHTLAAA